VLSRFRDLQVAGTDSGRRKSSIRLITLTAIRVFDLLRRPGMGAQGVADNPLVSAHSLLGTSPGIVARGFLPPHTTMLGNDLGVPVMLRWIGFGREAEHGRRSRRHDNRSLRMVLGDGVVNSFLVIGTVGDDRGNQRVDLVEQGAKFGGIIDLFAGQSLGDDRTGFGIDAQVSLAPSPVALGTVHPGPPAQGGVVRHWQVEFHQLEQEADQSFGLAQRLVKDGPQDQRRLDHQIRVARVTTRRGPRRCPLGFSCLSSKPDCQRATLSQPSLIILPVRNPVAGRWDPVTTVDIVLVRHGQAGRWSGRARFLSAPGHAGNYRIPAPNQG
jgi:hypothetical protein